MKRVRITYRAFIAIFAISLLLGGCKKEEEQGQAETKVWSTYSFTKVMQNQKTDISYDVQEPKCDIQMMRNETEGAQLIVTAAADISAYDLVVSDLKDDNGNVIEKNDISVYHQKYLVVNSKTDILNEDIVVGDYVPDMLLPLEVAREYGENKISAGNNQGITVEVQTSEATVPGIYTGTFTLRLDDESLDVPVRVEVWDIMQEGKREFQSSFLIYSNELLAGEYEVSDELIQRYQEFFLDYKVDTYVIRNDNSTENLAKEAVTFFEENNYNSICIPNTMAPNYTYDGTDADQIVDYIKEMVKISSEEKPYFEYLYIYPAYFDEVDMYPDKQEEFVNVFKKDGEWKKTLQRAQDAVKALPEYQSFSADLKKRVDESISKIPAVVPCTTTNEEWVDELYVTFCPYFSLFDEGGIAQRYQRQAKEKNNGNLWAYTCVGPENPYQTFHIDDYNLGTRVAGWMLKKENINGYLYWAVNLYEPINADTWRDVNPYETAERASDCAGDGFLCYPGAYYGSEYPFASIRLAAFRDTMDDYDMLSIYEQLLEKRASVYGIEIDFESCVEDLYNSLFHGAQYYNDESLVIAAREKLAQRILALQSELGLVAIPDQNGIKLYSTDGTLTIDGSDVHGTACAGGYEYIIGNQEKTGREITVSKGDVTAGYRVNASKDLSIAGASANSAGKAFLKDGRVEAVISSEEKSNEGAMARFRPYVQFEVGELTGTEGIHFTFHSETSGDMEGYVYLVMSDMTTKQIGSFLADGSDQEVEIMYHAEKITDEILKDVVALRVSFANVDRDGKLLADRTISLDNIYVEMR